MFKKISKQILPILLSALLILTAMPVVMVSAATTVTVLDGQVSVTDTADAITESGGVVTIQAKGGLISKKTNEVTIRNETAATQTLSFDYSASSYSSFSISPASGTYKAVLAAGTAITMSITSNSGWSNTTATLTLSNFSLTEAAASSEVGFIFDSALGSVTVGGETVDSNNAKDISSEGAVLAATPASGCEFLGWINLTDNSILSTDLEYKLVTAEDMSVKAAFSKTDGTGTPWFMLGTTTQQSASTGLLGLGKKYYYTVTGTHLYDNLTDAAIASESSTSKAIVLMNNGTLLAGDYTIPSGSTLLIPFDSSNTLYTTEPASTGTYTTPTAYRTLTMAEGANITVNGAISLSAQHRYAAGAKPAEGGGTPTGKVSFIKMNADSNITVNNGGVLYAYGFITGSGSVTAKSGSTVYENFQFTDFRGGSQTTDIENGVFPLSQYYIQNIEVPLTLEYGSTEYGYTTVYMNSADFSSSVAFIGGSGCMFNLTSGSVTKYYDGSTDRLRVEANGNMNISSVELEVGGQSINSADYELPINGNISVKVNGGASINISQDLAMLPGSEIIVSEGATCTVGSGYNMYIYDADEWGTFCGPQNAVLQPLPYVPSRTYNRTAADIVDASICVNGTVDATQGYVYTTSGGANIYSTGAGIAKITEGTQTITYQLVQNTGYTEIPLTPAKLKNADGTYVQSTTDTYTYTDGYWRCANHSYEEAVTAPTCTAQGYTTYTCTICYHSYIGAYTDATGHSHQAVVTAPTCTEQGYTTYTCACGDSYVSDYVAATGHSFGEWTVRIEAGCESEGLEYRTCTCGEEETRTIDALGHSYAEVVTAPTCTEQGYTTHTCSTCKHSYVDTYVAALGHSYNEVVTAPTCTEQGYTTYTCSVCGDSYTDNYVEALGHSFGDWEETVAPTCTTDGENRRDCSACDHYETEVVKAEGHSYNEVVTAPTCTEAGYTTHTCSACGDSFVDSEVEATGHSYSEVVTAPTCTEAGYTTHTCHCGDSYVDNEVEALGHSFGEWEVVKATHYADGKQSHKCSVCGVIEEITIPMIVCDIDSDEKTTGIELAELRKVLLGYVELDEAQSIMFDMNDDGVVSIVDLVSMKKFIAKNTTA